METIILIVLYLLCAGIILGTDDGKPWGFNDYVVLVFAWIMAPLGVGMWIGGKMADSGFFEENNDNSNENE